MGIFYLLKREQPLTHSFFYFSVWVFFHNHSRITGLQGKEEGIPLTCHYHFQPLHRHFGISQTITAESSFLHIGSNTLVSECKSLTTKLRALMVLIPFLVYCIRSCVFNFLFFFFIYDGMLNICFFFISVFKAYRVMYINRFYSVNFSASLGAFT